MKRLLSAILLLAITTVFSAQILSDLTIKEGAAPDAITGHGKVYVKSSDKDLYYKNSTGTEFNVLLGGGSSIDNLADVTITSAATDDYLKYNGSEWVNSTFPTLTTTLADLTDVMLSTLATDEVLKYDGSQWVNSPAPAGVSELLNLSDVTLTATATDDILVYDGSTWINTPSDNLFLKIDQTTPQTTVGAFSFPQVYVNQTSDDGSGNYLQVTGDIGSHGIHVNNSLVGGMTLYAPAVGGQDPDGKLRVESSSGSYGQIQIANPTGGEATMVMGAGFAQSDGLISSYSGNNDDVWAFGPGSYGNPSYNFGIGNVYLGTSVFNINGSSGNVMIGSSSDDTYGKLQLYASTGKSALVVNGGSGFFGGMGSFTYAVDIDASDGFNNSGVAINGELDIGNGGFSDPAPGKAYDLKMGGMGDGSIATLGDVSIAGEKFTFGNTDGTVLTLDDSGVMNTIGDYQVNGVSIVHDAVTIATPANGLSVSGQQLSMAAASTTATGALTNQDFNNFKQKDMEDLQRDGSFENGVTALIVGTGNTVTHSSDVYLFGTKSASITVNNSAVSATSTITNTGLASKWLGVSCYVKSSLPVQVCGWDGSTAQNCNTAYDSSNTWINLPSYVQADANGVSGYKILTAATATGTVNVDGCKISTNAFMVSATGTVTAPAKTGMEEWHLTQSQDTLANLTAEIQFDGDAVVTKEGAASSTAAISNSSNLLYWVNSADPTKFYCSKPCKLIASFSASIVTSGAYSRLYKNGTMIQFGSATPATNARSSVSTEITLNGTTDYITVGSSDALYNAATNCELSILAIASESTFLAAVPTGADIALYASNAAQSIPNDSITIIDFEDSMSTQSQSSFTVTTGAAWRATAVKAGWFGVNTKIAFAGLAWDNGEQIQLRLYKNNSYVKTLNAHLLENTQTIVQHLTGQGKIYLNVGDYIDIRVYQNRGAASQLDSGQDNVWIEIQKIGL